MTIESYFVEHAMKIEYMCFKNLFNGYMTATEYVSTKKEKTLETRIFAFKQIYFQCYTCNAINYLLCLINHIFIIN